MIPPHEHIIPLYDVFLPPTTRELHIVFECMEGNLYQLTKTRKGKPLALGLIASILKQVLEGLHHIHTHGFFHRDLKPENLLITTTGLADYPAEGGRDLLARMDQDVLVVVKIADFGLAREITSAPPYTEYVSTRWYRAPEILLHAPDYSPAVDVWALGTIMAELVTLEPLFPGTNEMDQLLRIAAVLGSPLRTSAHDTSSPSLCGGGFWPSAKPLCEQLGFRFPDQDAMPFASLFPIAASRHLVHLIFQMLRYDPEARLRPSEGLQHPFLQHDALFLQPRSRLLPHASVMAEPAKQQPSSLENSPVHNRPSGEEQAVRRFASQPIALHKELRHALDLETPRSYSGSHAVANTDRPATPKKQHRRHGSYTLGSFLPSAKRVSERLIGTPQNPSSAPNTASAPPSEDARPNSANVGSLPSGGTPIASTNRGHSPSTGFLSSWKSRKSNNTPRQSKEEQLKRREAELLAMRERSRAVLQKRTQLFG